jgi:iron-sulfur cluster assembly accessory protein
MTNTYSPIFPTPSYALYLDLLAIYDGAELYATMSLPRTTAALARSSTSTLKRFAASSATPRICPGCLRTFSNSVPYRQSGKRLLQTASAYHPSNLQPELPPRNFGVPDTSIAGGRPEINNSLPPQPSREQRNAQPADERPSVSIPEGEAQKPQPTSSMKPLRPRRFNFGARKATIKLSESAVLHLRELLDQPEPKLIRIGTRAKGCSGLAYHLEYVDKPSALDEQVEQDGVKVLIDNKALLNIIGSEMDWLSDKLNERFVFKNPNISKSHRTERVG